MQVLGNRLEDFEKMFDLKKDDLSKKIIECGGDSTFKTEIEKTNRNVICYQSNDLKKLPFENDQFDLALCAYQIFNYHDQKKIYALISEMSRVAFEVRIYPLCDEKGTLSPLLGIIMAQLQAANLRVEIRSVDYQYLKGNNAMLRVWREECVL